MSVHDCEHLVHHLALCCTVALGCLPLAHAVTDVRTGEVGEKYSKEFMQFHDCVYISILQAVNIFFVITVILLYIWKSFYSFIFNNKINIKKPEALASSISRVRVIKTRDKSTTY